MYVIVFGKGDNPYLEKIDTHSSQTISEKWLWGVC